MSTLLSDAGVEKSQRTLTLVGQKLTETQGDVIELRDKLAGLALIATIDPSHEADLIDARQRLAQSEAAMRELNAAQQLAADMARQAAAKALLARRDSDWAAAADLLAEAGVTAAALDSLLAQAGDLYGQIQQQMAQAASRVGRHLARPEYAVPPPNLADMVKLVLSNAGGPQAGPTLHMDAGERAGASVAGAVKFHTRQVMGYRPIGEQEEASHDD
jgi:hypothetical protein